MDLYEIAVVHDSRRGDYPHDLKFSFFSMEGIEREREREIGEKWIPKIKVMRQVGNTMDVSSFRNNS